MSLRFASLRDPSRLRAAQGFFQANSKRWKTGSEVKPLESVPPDYNYPQHTASHWVPSERAKRVSEGGRSAPGRPFFHFRPSFYRVTGRLARSSGFTPNGLTPFWTLTPCIRRDSPGVRTTWSAPPLVGLGGRPTTHILVRLCYA